MKRWLFAMLCLLALSTYSCSKKNADDNNNILLPEVPDIKWDWTGTPPLTMKVNNAWFPLDDSTVVGDDGRKNLEIHARDTGNTIKFILELNKGVQSNKIYPVPSGAYGAYTYLDLQNDIEMHAVSGAVKILNISSVEVEGLFVGVLKDTTGRNKDSIVISEGYFRVRR